MYLSKQTNRICMGTGFLAILISILSFSCEPLNWAKYVLSEPEPLRDLDVTEVLTGRGVVAIHCTFTRPAFTTEELGSSEGNIPDAYFFLRKEGGTADEEIGVDTIYLHNYSADEVVTVDGMFVSENDIEKGESYVLVGYTVDSEGQRSGPTLSDPFVIPLYTVGEPDE